MDGLVHQGSSRKASEELSSLTETKVVDFPVLLQNPTLATSRNVCQCLYPLLLLCKYLAMMFNCNLYK